MQLPAQDKKEIQMMSGLADWIAQNYAPPSIVPEPQAKKPSFMLDEMEMQRLSGVADQIAQMEQQMPEFSGVEAAPPDIMKRMKKYEAKAKMPGPPPFMGPRRETIGALPGAEKMVPYAEVAAQQPKEEIPFEVPYGGKLEKPISTVAKTAAAFGNAFFYNVPELVAGRAPELTPEGEFQEVLAAGANLGGTIAGPFHTLGRFFKKATSKWIPKTVTGTTVKGLLMNAGTLFGHGFLSTWTKNPDESLLVSKMKAGLSSAQIAPVFAATSFLNMPGKPILSFLLRMGLNDLGLDLLSGQRPWDERTKMQKAFDYGVNAYFSRHGANVKQIKAGLNIEKFQRDLQKELDGYNADLKKDGMPEGQIDETAALNQWLERAEVTSARTPEQIKTFVEEPREKVPPKRWEGKPVFAYEGEEKRKRELLRSSFDRAKMGQADEKELEMLKAQVPRERLVAEGIIKETPIDITVTSTPEGIRIKQNPVEKPVEAIKPEEAWREGANNEISDRQLLEKRKLTTAEIEIIDEARKEEAEIYKTDPAAVMKRRQARLMEDLTDWAGKNLKPKGEGEIEFLPAEGPMEHAGEAVSPESISRAKNNEFFVYDTSKKTATPVPPTETADIQPKPKEIIVQRNTNTQRLSFLNGERATVRPGEIESKLPEPKTKAAPRKPGVKKISAFKPMGGDILDFIRQHNGLNKVETLEGGWKGEFLGLKESSFRGLIRQGARLSPEKMAELAAEAGLLERGDPAELATKIDEAIFARSKKPVEAEEEGPPEFPTTPIPAPRVPEVLPEPEFKLAAEEKPKPVEKAVEKAVEKPAAAIPTRYVDLFDSQFPKALADTNISRKPEKMGGYWEQLRKNFRMDNPIYEGLDLATKEGMREAIKRSLIGMDAKVRQAGGEGEEIQGKAVQERYEEVEKVGAEEREVSDEDFARTGRADEDRLAKPEPAREEEIEFGRERDFIARNAINAIPDKKNQMIAEAWMLGGEGEERYVDAEGKKRIRKTELSSLPEIQETLRKQGLNLSTEAIRKRLRVVEDQIKNIATVQAKVLEDDIDKKVLDGKDIDPGETRLMSIYRKLTGDDGNLHIVAFPMIQLPDSVRDGLSRAYAVEKDLMWKGRDLFRIPVWNPRFYKLVKQMLRVDQVDSIASERSIKAAKPYFFLKSKQRVNETFDFEDSNERVLSHQELAARGLTQKEIVAHDGVRTALDYIQRTFLRQMMIHSGISAGEADHLIDTHYKPGYMPHMRFGRYIVVTKGGPANKITLEYASFQTERQANDYADQVEAGLGTTVMQRGRKQYVAQELVKVKDTDPHTGKEFERRYIDHDRDFQDPNAFITILQNFPVLDNILTARGITDPDILKMKSLLGEEVLKYFASGRLKHRRDVPGYEKDYSKALERYFVTTPASYARKFMRMAVESEWKNLTPADQTYGRHMVDYWLGMEQREGKFYRGARRFAYNFYLAAKPSFFVMNYLQRVQTTLPLAYEKTNNLAQAFKVSLIAQKKEMMLMRDLVKLKAGKLSNRTTEADLSEAIRRASYIPAEDKTVLINMIESGEMGALRQREILGTVPGHHGSVPQKVGSRIMSGLEVFGEASEKLNRLHATLTSLEIDRVGGQRFTPEQKYERASDFTGKSQFIYSKANRFLASRGVLSPLAVFKSFALNYFNFNRYLWQNNKKAAGLSLGIFLGMGGLLGVPGVQGLSIFGKEVWPGLAEAVIWAAKKTGLIDDDKSVNEIAREFKETYDKKALSMLFHGIPAAVGVEGSWAFGSPDVFDLASVTLIKSLEDMFQGITAKSVSPTEKGLRASPTTVKHLGRAYQMGKLPFLKPKEPKMPTDIYDKPKLSEEDIKSMPKEIRAEAGEVFLGLTKPEDIGPIESTLYTMGFPSRKLAKYGEDIFYVKGLAKKTRDTKADYHRAIAQYLYKLDNPEIRTWLDQVKPAQFRSSFWQFTSQLDEKDQKKILDIIKEAEERGYALSYTSVLNHLKEYIQ